MITTALIGLALVQGLRVEGLRADETAVPLAPAAEAPDREQAAERVRGRVLDAATGLPVAGATVETWTEEIDRLAPGLRLVGQAHSGADGGFEVRVRDGALAAEKARVRAPGYLAAPGVAGDLEQVLLFPWPGWTPELTVVDLEGRPLADALVTSTYSCAHDVPAFRERTGARGRAQLPEWGLQARTPELRVRAEGYGACKYLDFDDVLPALGAPSVPLRLARRAPFGARVVDAARRPVAGAALHVVDGDGFHVVRTAADGRFRVAAPYGEGDVTVYVLGEGLERHLFSGRLPRGREVALAAPDAELELDWARVVLELPPRGDGAPSLPVHVFHASGWNDSFGRRDDGPLELELPAGTSVLALGGPFSGWEQQLVELELEPGAARTVRVAPRAEPRLTVLGPERRRARVVVQVGDESTELESAGTGSDALFAPRGAPVVVLVEGRDVRRLALPPLEGDAVADLRPEACRIAEAAAGVSPERVQLEVVALDAAGAPLAGSLDATGPGEPQVVEVGPGAFEVDARRDAPLALEFLSAGHAATWRTVRAIGDGQRLELRPTPLAALEVRSELELVIEGPPAEELGALYPGPLRLSLRGPDGAGLELGLVLRPGERRTLRVE